MPSYQDLMERLAAVPAALAAEQASIRQWYDEQVATAEETLRRAQRALAGADRQLTEAEAMRAWTDTQAHLLWQTLQTRWGGLGPTPEPAGSVGPDDDPVEHIHAAAEAVGAAAAVPRPRGRWSPVAAAVVLVAVAATLAVAWWFNYR